MISNSWAVFCILKNEAIGIKDQLTYLGRATTRESGYLCRVSGQLGSPVLSPHLWSSSKPDLVQSGKASCCIHVLANLVVTADKHANGVTAISQLLCKLNHVHVVRTHAGHGEYEDFAGTHQGEPNRKHHHLKYKRHLQYDMPTTSRAAQLVSAVYRRPVYIDQLARPARIRRHANLYAYKLMLQTTASSATPKRGTLTTMPHYKYIVSRCCARSRHDPTIESEIGRRRLVIVLVTHEPHMHH